MRLALRTLATTLALASSATIAPQSPAAQTALAVLSAGAVEEGVLRLTRQYKDATGHAVVPQFGTGPEIEKRLAADEPADVLIAPLAVVERAAKAGRVSVDTAVPVARVGVGVTVRRGAPRPAVGTLDELKAALIAADSVVYNQASTGQYLETLFERMDILDLLRAKTTRYGNAAQVLEHVIAGRGNELGFGPITEIKSFEPKGVVLVAPLPADVQNYTTYVAAVTTRTTARQQADALIQYLTSAPAREVFAATGAQ